MSKRIFFIWWICFSLFFILYCSKINTL